MTTAYRIYEPISFKDLEEQEPGPAASDGMKPVWATTRSDAQARVRQEAPVFRAALCVERIDVPTDQLSIVDMLNGHVPDHCCVIQRWRGTNRGGLKEIE